MRPRVPRPNDFRRFTYRGGGHLTKWKSPPGKIDYPCNYDSLTNSWWSEVKKKKKKKKPDISDEYTTITFLWISKIRLDELL